MLNIGITGGIGSGKTTACKIFEILGIPIYYSDLRAKQLMIEDEELVNDVKTLLGTDAYFENGALNRKFVAGKVFSNPDLLSSLNGLVHPKVWEDADKWSQQQIQSAHYVINEAALLFETGSYKRFDKIILVTAPEDLRIKRVMNRDSSTLNQVKERIDKQLKDAVKIQLADFIINNDEKSSMIFQILAIHKSLIEYLKK